MGRPQQLNVCRSTKYARRTRRNARKFWVEFIREFYGELKCEICDYEIFPALEFHHVDPKKKKFIISQRTYLVPNPKRIEEMKKELRKCRLLCANCHRLIHYVAAPS